MKITAAAAVLQLLDRSRFYEEALRRHDEARNEYVLGRFVARDLPGWNDEVTTYVAYHLHRTSGVERKPSEVLSLAVALLDETFEPGTYPTGYHAALAAGLGETNGGLPAVLNAIVRGFKGRSTRAYLERVFHEHVNVLSREDAETVATALAEQYARPLRLLGKDMNAFVGCQDPWRALSHLRGVLEPILAAADRW